MPEGPEVYIITKALNTKFKDKKIYNTKIHSNSKYNKNDKFLDNVKGLTIKRVSSKGKKIIFELNNGSYILSSLGLEGKWLIVDVKDDEPHLSVTIEFVSGEILSYFDSRHFGSIVVCIDRKMLDSKLLTVGTSWIPSEMFPLSVTKSELYTHLSNTRLKNKNIMMFLMDQKYTSGVGNYIRSEALFLCQLSPYRLINNITKSESDCLYESILDVMNRSIKSGGHTLKSFVGVMGHKGGYVPEIYGRVKTLTTGFIVQKEKDSQSRSIFWVPSVQV
jgi:formamidopyrimidine-DNA glycosylase